MTPSGPVRMVFFDVGATLIDPHPSMGHVYRRVLEPMGVEAPEDEFLRVFRLIWDRMSSEIGRGVDRYNAFPGGEPAYWRTYVGRVLEMLGSDLDVEAATRALHTAFAEPDAWAVYPDSRVAIDRLSAEGVRLGVISNWDSRLPRLLTLLGLAPFFDTLVWSAGVGVEKPSRLIFEHALSEAGIVAHEAMHVGDDLGADYRGAIDAGMRGVLLRRRGAAPDGVLTISSLSELPAFLDRRDFAG